MKKKAVNIIWFKRDLRFTDHEPLFMAQQENLPILLVYFFEPSVMAYDDSDIRHWRFVYESLQEMQSQLKSVDAQIYFFHNEVQTVFKELLEIYDVKQVFSHQEIGNKVTFDRDIAMQSFFDDNTIHDTFLRQIIYTRQIRNIIKHAVLKKFLKHKETLYSLAIWINKI